METPLALELEGLRKELTAYICRLVLRSSIAEEIVQTAFLRVFENESRLPADAEGRRAWIFRVASNLAFDQLRRHSTWREVTLFDLRERAESDPSFMERSAKLSGTPETKAIAREHLVACFACVLRNLPEQKAAALLLKEVHGFSLEEVASCLDASAGQIKNWLQEARASMVGHYGRTCALIAKEGVCHQCTELDDFFSSRQGSPLREGESGSLQARLSVVDGFRCQAWGPWHRMLFELLDEAL